ncbi:MAG: BTAD domain-containing putative transcriptional regulator [Sporomusaceae bacterium]|nr:BTAD domain-containing putative transcriptional regulator [Sporomusaceae bacterium]
MRSVTLLQSKLTIPALENDVILRESLIQMLQEAARKRLVVFTAGAGYGKTTVLVQYLMGKKRICWYNPGPEDDNVYTFSLYLAGALDALLPGIRLWYEEKISEEEKFDWKIAFSLLMAGMELFSSKSPASILVIDDWHHVQDSSEIRLFFNRFLACRPEWLQVILLSRQQVALAEVERLRASDEVLDITEAELTFSLTETKNLLQQFHSKLDHKQQIKQIYEYTEGWVIAIRLFMNYWQKEGLFPGESWQLEPDKLKALFEYLAYDVLERQTLEMQNFLLQTALTDSFSLAYCKEVMGDRFFAALLEKALKKGLFLYKVGPDVYRYHNLFREFLCREAKFRIGDLAATYNKIGLFYRKRKLIERALPFLLLAENWQALCELLCEEGRHWVSSGRGKLLKNYIEELPVEYRQRPEIYLALGDDSRFACHYDQAIAWYNQAKTAFDAAKCSSGWSKAMRSIGETYVDIIQPVHAQNYLKLAYKALDVELTQEKAAILGLMAENMINRGNPRRAERYRRLMTGLMPLGLEDKNNLAARILLRTGRLKEATEMLEKRYSREQASYHVPRSFRETTLLLSLCYTYSGKQEAAISLAQAGIALAEKMRSPFVLAIAYVRKGHALLLREATRKEAWELYGKALEIAERMGISRSKTELLQGLSLLHALKGDWTKARKIGLEGIAITETVQDRWFTAVLYHTLGMGAVMVENQADAKTFLQKGLALFSACGDSFGQAVSFWWLALLAAKLKQRTEFQEFYQQFSQLVGEYGYEFLLEGPSLLGNVAALSYQPFAEWSAEYDESDRNGDKTNIELRIKTLGPLQLWRYGEEVASREWRRGSSRQLLGLLLTERNCLVSKERIMCELWPEVNQQTALRNFKAALHDLLAVLEPLRRPRSPSSYIIRKGSCYQLLSENMVIDVSCFETDLAKGMRLAEESLTDDDQDKNQKAQMILANALKGYEGEYLAGESGSDAVQKERERLRTLAVNGAELLALLHMKRQEYEQALSWSQWILRQDICWEKAYQFMLELYGKQANQVMLVRTYQRCVDVLETELSVTPSPETVKLFRRYRE